jgi:hypothetical protein
MLGEDGGGSIGVLRIRPDKYGLVAGSFAMEYVR